MANIFISYARADRDRIEKIASALEAEGYSVWWDRQIVGGAEFSEEIEKELAAAKAVIACWSAESSKSRWVKDEAGIAANDGKLIALSLEGAEPPIGFKQFHAVDYSKDTAAGYVELKRAIDAKLSGATAAATPRARKSGRLSAPVLAGGLVALIAIVAAIFILTRNEAVPAAVADTDPSIAVLPFADMSAAGDQEYFGDGMAEEILNMLAKSPELKIAGRTSSFQFKDEREDLRTIGETLAVANILEGSVRKAGDKLRITAQLIRASDGFHIWSETYDGDVNDVFAVQESIAISIADALQSSLGISAGSQAEARTDNPEAYEHYLRGLGHYAERGDGVSDAIKSFEKAVALDPEFAAAWGGLSLSFAVAPGWLEENEGREVSRTVFNRKSLYSANRAIEINPELAVSQHAFGNIMMQLWQWETAEDALLKALSLEPNSHLVLEDYREFLLKVGRPDEGVAIARKMVELEPMNIHYQRLAGIDEFYSSNYEAALEHNRKVFDLSGDFVRQGDLQRRAAVLVELDKMEEAIAFVSNCSKCAPEAKEHVLSILAQVKNPSPGFKIQSLNFDPGGYFSYKIFTHEEIFEASKINFLSGGNSIIYDIGIFAEFQSDPRSKGILEDAGLVRYWRSRGWPNFCRPLGDDDFVCGDVNARAG